MTSGAAAAIEAVLAKVDFLANRGALIMRAAAVFTLAGAVAATLAVFSALGWSGFVIGAVCLFPGWILWRYGDRLANALDTDRIRGQVGEATELAKSRIGEVVKGIGDTRRRPMRGGFRVLKLVRGLRGDFDRFGIDIAGIAEVTNPGSILMAAISLIAGIGFWFTAAVGLLIRLVVS